MCTIILNFSLLSTFFINLFTHRNSLLSFLSLFLFSLAYERGREGGRQRKKEKKGGKDERSPHKQFSCCFVDRTGIVVDKWSVALLFALSPLPILILPFRPKHLHIFYNNFILISIKTYFRNVLNAKCNFW